MDDVCTITITITLSTPTGLLHQLATASSPVGIDQRCHPETSAAALLAQVPTQSALATAIFEAYEDAGIGCSPE